MYRSNKNLTLIKPFYTILELAGYLCLTKGQAKRFLRAANVRMDLIGNTTIIYLSELQNSAPDLVASIEEAIEMNRSRYVVAD